MLVRGNHEYKNEFIDKLGWRWVGDIKVLSGIGTTIVLCHRPMQVWDESMHGSWHLYGHVHGMLPEHRTCFKTDVGVDVRGMRPISLEEVKAIMATRVFVPPDKRRVYYEEDLATWQPK
jgi:calcineurin-like phosphoesterase family protein